MKNKIRKEGRELGASELVEYYRSSKDKLPQEDLTKLVEELSALGLA